MDTTPTSPAPVAEACFRWWYKGKLPTGEILRLEGRVLAASHDEASDKVERVMRKIYPTVRWMNGTCIEGAPDRLVTSVGPTTQKMKTARLGPEWAHLQEGIFVRVKSRPQAQCPELACVQPQTGGAVALLKVFTAEALTLEVLDRRMIGNLLVIELESYLRDCSPNAKVLREIMAKWRQIPTVR